MWFSNSSVLLSYKSSILLSEKCVLFSPRPWVFASMISLMRPAPTLFLAASFTLYQVPQRRLSSLNERSLELMNTSFHSSVLSTEYCSTKPVHKQGKYITKFHYLLLHCMKLFLLQQYLTLWHWFLYCPLDGSVWLYFSERPQLEYSRAGAAISYLPNPRLGWRWQSIYANEATQYCDCFYNQLPLRAKSLLLWDTSLVIPFCPSFHRLVNNYEYIYIYMDVSCSVFLCTLCTILFPTPPLPLTNGMIDSKTLEGLTCADDGL